MKAPLLLFVALFATFSPAQFVTTFSSSAPSNHLQSLAEAGLFALGPVGYAGHTSEEELLFKAIFSLDPERTKQELERLNSSGSPQAMTYALVGMRKLDPTRYSEMLSAARTSNVTVTTMWGCVMEDEKLRNVANDLDSGKYDEWLRWMSPTIGHPSSKSVGKT